jgi:hypothetical protein
MILDEELHEYRQGNEKYQSVTQLIEKLKKPFPKELIAGKIATRDGIEAEEVIQEWDLNASISANYGTSIHQGIEYWIKYGKISKLPHVKLAVEKFAEHNEREKLKTEVIVFNDEFKLAGTIDLIEVIEKGVANLKDIKTNYELDKKGDGNFLAPLNDMSCTKINCYRIQLSIYKHLLELKGKKIDKLIIEHWNGEEFNSIELEPLTQEQINNILEWKKKSSL